MKRQAALMTGDRHAHAHISAAEVGQPMTLEVGCVSATTIDSYLVYARASKDFGTY